MTILELKERLEERMKEKEDVEGMISDYQSRLNDGGSAI
jgi:hypothetical protein